MKLNIGDVVELQFEGSNLPGVVMAVTPERVEVAFTYNLFMEGPAVLTWGDGTQQPIKVGLDNGLTKLHLRIPLEEVARAQAVNAAASPPEPAAVRIDDPGIEPEPILAADPDLDMFSGAALDADALSATAPAAPQSTRSAPAPPQGPPPAKAENSIQRPGIWVDLEIRVDGFDPQSGGSFVGTTTKVCVAGFVVRLESGSLKIGSRVQLLFAIDRDTFDLPGVVMGQEGTDLFGIQYDEPDARPRLLKAVMARSKAEVRPQRGWR